MRLEVLIMAGCVSAVWSAILYDSNNPACNARPPPGSGCVAKGSIAEATDGNCVPCFVDSQCEQGSCDRTKRVCQKPGTGCYPTPNADCSNCGTDEFMDLAGCNCGNSDFPNNWVTCTDGSNVKDDYSSFSQDFTPYEPKFSSEGGLSEIDDFAIGMLCQTNMYRAVGGIPPVKWNDEIAKFAYDYIKSQGANHECQMKHNEDRDNVGGFDSVGENLYTSWGSVTNIIDETDAVQYGVKAVDAWFDEMIYYQYGGEDQAYDACPMRNTNVPPLAQIGHLTALLWDQTTDMGCAYAICGHKILVGCNYGPHGNMQGQAAFNNAAATAYNDWSPKNQEYQGLPTCYIEPLPEGSCAGMYGRTCTFPYNEPWNNKQINNCAEALAFFGDAPWCYLGSQGWDICKDSSC